MTEPAHFRVDTRLTTLLGENYRSTEAALKELIDNAWDADATTVSITLPRPLTDDPIIISDDGHGMTPEEVRSEYLAIARDRQSRKGEKTAKYGRQIKGRKGIGKFAGLAAARIMDIQTTAKGMTTRLEIDKDVLLQARRDLEEIPLPISTQKASAPSGTFIALHGLNQSLSFPTEEKLRLALIHEYGRAENFLIEVNGSDLSVDDLPGKTRLHEEKVADAGTVCLRFTITEGKKLPANPGIVVRVGGKVVGDPSFFGLDHDPEIPSKLLRRVYGEVEANGLDKHVTADWGAIIENSKPYQQLRDWVASHAREALYETHKQEIDLQKARIQRQINQRISRLPEHRRGFAEQAIHKILSKFYGERDDRVATVANVVLDAMEKDEYWVVVQNIDAAKHSDISKLSEALEEFGLLEMVLIADRAKRRLQFLDSLEVLITDPHTLESQIHTAIEKSLWLLGPQYALLSSNKSLKNVVETFMSRKYEGNRGTRRPDLLLAADPGSRYLLIEFKRPNHSLSRKDESQAKEYRDELTQYLQAGPIDIILLGGRREITQTSVYDTPDVQFMTYTDILSRNRKELKWLIEQV